MNSIDPRTLKIGDILRSISDYSEVPKSKILDKKESGVLYIKSRNRKNPWAEPDTKEFNFLGSAHAIDCHSDMLDSEYIFLGHKSYYRYIDALTLTRADNEYQYTVPLCILRKTDKRVIDLRNIPCGNLLTKYDIANAVIPSSEQTAIMDRIKNFEFKKNYEDLHKHRLKWFFRDVDLPFKILLAEVIDTYNMHKAVKCPGCRDYIKTSTLVSDGYTRAGKVFIRCNTCGNRVVVSLVDPKDFHTTENPFCLELT